MLTFLSSRRKYILFTLAFMLICILGFEYFSRHYLFAYSPKEHTCLPYRVWLIEKGVMPRRGEYVSFVGRGIPHFADGVRWVKMITGMPGDRVEVQNVSLDDPKEAETQTVEVNGMPVTLRVQGYVHLQNPHNVTLTYRVFEKDTKGRKMPVVQAQEIPAGKYFVIATSARTYDSRYWGLVDEKNILGAAYPMF